VVGGGGGGMIRGTLRRRLCQASSAPLIHMDIWERWGGGGVTVSCASQVHAVHGPQVVYEVEGGPRLLIIPGQQQVGVVWILQCMTHSPRSTRRGSIGLSIPLCVFSIIVESSQIPLIQSS